MTSDSKSAIGPAKKPQMIMGHNGREAVARRGHKNVPFAQTLFGSGQASGTEKNFYYL
jgi:hypothetical protein